MHENCKAQMLSAVITPGRKDWEWEGFNCIYTLCKLILIFIENIIMTRSSNEH